MNQIDVNLIEAWGPIAIRCQRDPAEALRRFRRTRMAVMQRIPRRHQLTLPHWWTIGAAAILALMLAYVGYRETRVQTLRKSEKQLVFALQLTSRKLSAVNEKLKKASVHVSVQENL